eukprot:4802811-Amphidinium_carterae.1
METTTLHIRSRRESTEPCTTTKDHATYVEQRESTAERVHQDVPTLERRNLQLRADSYGAT